MSTSVVTGQTRRQEKAMGNMSTIATGTLGDTPTGTWRIDSAHSSVSFRSGT
jgi:polyisoprenoid-binding protein YceI